MPGTIIRLAAGRNTMPESEQAMCFMAGANAVFTGNQMLTTPCESIKFFNLNVPHHFFDLAFFRFSMG
jgi:biotin synthase-like enzyme